MKKFYSRALLCLVLCSASGVSMAFISQCPKVCKKICLLMDNRNGRKSMEPVLRSKLYIPGNVVRYWCDCYGNSEERDEFRPYIGTCNSYWINDRLHLI